MGLSHIVWTLFQYICQSISHFTKPYGVWQHVLLAWIYLILGQAFSSCHANSTGRNARSFDDQLLKSNISSLKLLIKVEVNHLLSLHGQTTSHKTQALLIYLPMIYLLIFAPPTSVKTQWDHQTYSYHQCYRGVPYHGKLRRGKFSTGKIIHHLENIFSLFPYKNFPHLHLRVKIFWLFYCF